MWHDLNFDWLRMIIDDPKMWHDIIANPEIRKEAREWLGLIATPIALIIVARNINQTYEERKREAKGAHAETNAETEVKPSRVLAKKPQAKSLYRARSRFVPKPVETLLRHQ